MNTTMHLYEAEIRKPDGSVWVWMVAPSLERAVELVSQHYAYIGGDYDRVAIGRIDEELEGDDRHGLEALLTTTTVGFASHAPSLGWVAHVAAVHKLGLFALEDERDAITFVVAPTQDVAFEVLWANKEIGEGETLLYRSVDPFEHMTDAQRDADATFLQFGPIGIAKWTEGGWSVG